MRREWVPVHRFAVLVAAFAIGLVSCSSGAAQASVRHAASSPAKVTAAKALIKKYEHPSAFPVKAKLKKRPTGDTIAVMSCGTSVCGLLWDLMQPAASLMGVHMKEYKAGPAASTIPSAYSAMFASNPSAVIILPTVPVLVEPYMLELKSKHIPFVSSGMVWTKAQLKEYGIHAQQAGAPFARIGGVLQAAWAVAKYGSKADVLIENIPDLNFSPPLVAAFTHKMHKLCSACTVQQLTIPITTMGTTDVGQEVSYLQAHKGINVVATASGETFYGLPAALSAAGIHVALVTNAPAPENLANINSGQQTAGVGADDALFATVEVDAAARLIVGQPVTPAEASGAVVQEMLTKSNLPSDVSKGWSAYPNYLNRFAKLWGVKKS